MLASFFFLLTLLLGVRGKSYLESDFNSLCPRDGSKLEVELGSKALILTLRPGLKEALLCHLELETFSGFGLHVFLAEMALDGDEGEDNCKDFVQFARDVLTFTTHRSPKFCGRRHALNFTSDTELYRTLGTKGDGRQRLYIEERDREMDVWLSVGADKEHAKNLTMVVTPFKKSCSRSDSVFRRCDRTRPYCIRREYFCDRVANCAWPSGERASDERKCEGYEGFGSQSSSIGLANLPLLIIGIVICLGALALLFVALRHVYEVWVKYNEEDEDLRRRQERQRQHNLLAVNNNNNNNNGEFRHESPLLVPSVPMEELQQPPTYEEAVKLEDNRPSAPPPPYTT